MTAIALLLIGIVVTVLSAASLWRTVRLYLVGSRASGVLVNWRRAYRRQWLGNGLYAEFRHFYPIVRFELPVGSHYEIVSDLAYDGLDWPAGCTFAVRYDPANPKDATADPLTPTWFLLTVFLIAGLILLYVGLRLCFR